MHRLVAGLELVLLTALCVWIAFCPLVANLLLQRIPHPQPLLGGFCFSAAAVSWAFVIYFAWAYLPSMDGPPSQRLRSWAEFLALELVYPMVAWGLEPESRLYLAADIASYASTCVTLGTTALLLSLFREQVRRGEGYGNLPALLSAMAFITVPGVLVEMTWWIQVELADGGGMGPVLRWVGLLLGTLGVWRNLVDADLG